MSQVRSVVRIIKEHNGEMTISKLAEESEEDVDDLLPLIEACELLGFAQIDDSDIKITQLGEKLTISGPNKIIRKSLEDVEPFKSTISVLSRGRKTTQELIDALRSREIELSEDQALNELMLRKMLRNWGTRVKLLLYDEEEDSWSLPKK